MYFVNLVCLGLKLMYFKAILLDIEGTTTPIDFVHKTLFPYSWKRAHDFVQSNLANLQDEIASLHAQHKLDLAKGEFPPPFDEFSVESLTAYLHYLIDNDRKATALKSIQGQIWQAGYQSGEILGEIFDDVLPAFKRWKSEGKEIAIFSSGSVLAQKLIFGYSSSGDLTSYISNYFDTTSGAKREPKSYQKIASKIGFPPVEILFVSDVIAELTAASSAGMNCKLSVRPNNSPIENPLYFESIYSFDEI